MLLAAMYGCIIFILFTMIDVFRMDETLRQSSLPLFIGQGLREWTLRRIGARSMNHLSETPSTNEASTSSNNNSLPPSYERVKQLDSEVIPTYEDDTKGSHLTLAGIQPIVSVVSEQV